MKGNREGARESWVNHQTIMGVWPWMKERGREGWVEESKASMWSKEVLAKPLESSWAKIGLWRCSVSLKNESSLVSLPHSIFGGEQSMEEVTSMQMLWGFQAHHMGLSVNYTPCIGGLWSTFSWLPQGSRTTLNFLTWTAKMMKVPSLICGRLKEELVWRISEVWF